MEVVAEDTIDDFEKANITMPSIIYNRDGSSVLKLSKENEITPIIEKCVNVLTCIDNGTEKITLLL